MKLLQNFRFVFYREGSFFTRTICVRHHDFVFHSLLIEFRRDNRFALVCLFRIPLFVANVPASELVGVFRRRFLHRIGRRSNCLRAVCLHRAHLDVGAVVHREVIDGVDCNKVWRAVYFFNSKIRCRNIQNCLCIDKVAFYDHDIAFLQRADFRLVDAVEIISQQIVFHNRSLAYLCYVVRCTVTYDFDCIRRNRIVFQIPAVIERCIVFVHGEVRARACALRCVVRFNDGRFFALRREERRTQENFYGAFFQFQNIAIAFELTADGNLIAFAQG